MSGKSESIINSILQISLNKRTLSILIFCMVLLGFMSAKAQNYKYPDAPREDVIENYHGTNVHDYYRWLEDPESKKTQSWVAAENKITQSYLQTFKGREKIKERLTELWNYPKYSVPTKEGNRYFFYKNDGLQNQSALFMQETLKSEAILILDPNKLSKDGTVALSTQKFNKDGTLLAYGLSQSGSDRQEIKVRNIDTGKDYEEVIKWCKFAGIAWKHDNSGFYYNRYPEPGTVATEDLSNYSQVYWHKLGTDQSMDKLVYEDPKRKELGFFPFTSDDGKYLLIHVYNGTASENQLYYREVESNGPFIKLLDKEDASYEYIDNDGSTFFIKTNLDAPRERIVAIDIKHPEQKNWKELIPEHEDVISSVSIINNQFVIAYMHNAHHLIKIHSLDGKFVREVALPTLGSIEGLSGKREDQEMFIKFTSFTYPSNIFRYDFKSGKLENFRDSEINFDPSAYETKQVFYPSKDGTKVSMFITYKKGIKLDGNNPTFLYGYGGFNVNLTPSFSISRLVWLENGGIFALANLRGGGEYGEDWHKAGMLEKKQNVFNDFIAAGEWLIREKYTNHSKLAINGGSNGGLLVAASMVQRPDLFGAVICSVPVIDMLRYHKFTVGRYWIPEYGNAEANAEHFKFMYAYSPLHNIKKGVSYPPTLITTADTDDRVVPAHGKKFAAALQEANKGENPILIRVEMKAGHGAGKPTSKVIDEQADIYAFLFKTFGIK
jgi:prolyl oligopeptidase